MQQCLPIHKKVEKLFQLDLNLLTPPSRGNRPNHRATKRLEWNLEHNVIRQMATDLVQPVLVGEPLQGDRLPAWKTDTRVHDKRIRTEILYSLFHIINHQDFSYILLSFTMNYNLQRTIHGNRRLTQILRTYYQEITHQHFQR